MILVLFTSLILSFVNKSFANNSASSDQAEQSCIGCHSSAAQSWGKSDHAKSMALPDKNSVLANFDNAEVEHYGQKARFYTKGNQYHVTITYDDNVDNYQIKYTFGHFPLQQYLVDTGNGKLHVLPFAWDSRKKSDGGQRWYHNYSHEEIRPEDRLHWRQPLQNWNGMCADCHSDGLKRNYNADENSFDSQFDNINVGCLSCHGDMSEHEKQNKSRNVAKDITSSQHPTGQWLRSLGEKTAHWQGEKRDNSFMDNCFSCHALRAPLTDGIVPNTPFLDQFMPQLPAAPTHFADGQIKEEVYVYGSFLQSKMFDKGVNCIDCHNPHTMKLKIEGNALCLQCHGSEVYNVKSHHQHEDASAGSECVNCHMPTQRYMGVDDRRDHSFKIPKPHLSTEFDTPNACIQCHDDKSDQWATQNLEKWHGKPKPTLASKRSLMELNTRQAIKLEDHLAIIADKKLDVISRASALKMLNFTTQTISIEILKPYLVHKEDLLRLSAATAALLLTPAERALHLSPLLTDKYKAVRVAAARSLITSKLAAKDIQAFDHALDELLIASDVSSWRGEGRANQGALALDQNDLLAAEKAFLGSIKVEPYFDAGYINLADVYRALQQPLKVEKTLVKGMNNIKNSGALNYVYGLFLVRQKNLAKAVTFFEQAMLLSPNNSQYAYTLVLAMDGTGQSEQAMNKLKRLIESYPDKGQLRDLGLYLAQKLNNRADYDYFMKL